MVESTNRQTTCVITIGWPTFYLEIAKITAITKAGTVE
jgi:hypothetical protein